MFECWAQNRDGLIILVNFSKAFEEISLDFIDTASRGFGFGEDTKKWIRTFS